MYSLKDNITMEVWASEFVVQITIILKNVMSLCKKKKILQSFFYKRMKTIFM